MTFTHKPTILCTNTQSLQKMLTFFAQLFCSPDFNVLALKGTISANVKFTVYIQSIIGMGRIQDCLDMLSKWVRGNPVSTSYFTSWPVRV